MPRPIRATISAGALTHNLMVARRLASAGAGAKIWAVLKANAYGHGLERAARVFGGADGFERVSHDEGGELPAGRRVDQA